MAFVFVTDDDFPLRTNCMKPFPQSNLDDRKRIFNYRLSRMRRIRENVFGIWVNRFRVFTSTMALHPDKAVGVTLATLVLHNMLRNKSAESYMPDIAIDIEASDGSVTGGSWRNNNSIDFTRSLPAHMSNRYNFSTKCP